MTSVAKMIDYGTGIESVQRKVRSCILNRESFGVVNVGFGKQSQIVDMVEREIESAGLSCRVRTANRGWAVAALTVATLGGAAAAGAAIAAHDLATKDPDYEVIKEMLGSDVAVEYQKQVK